MHLQNPRTKTAQLQRSLQQDQPEGPIKVYKNGRPKKNRRRLSQIRKSQYPANFSPGLQGHSEVLILRKGRLLQRSR